MDSSRVSRRLDGRCLFPQRCFSSSPPDRVPTCVSELLEREKPSQSSAALYGKRILLSCRDCGVYPHTGHALDHFWRNISLRHLQRTGVGLDRALLALHSLLHGTRTFHLDSDSCAVCRRPFSRASRGEIHHLISRRWRSRLLLPDFQLSLLAWHGLLRKPVLHPAHARLYFWLCNAAPAFRHIVSFREPGFRYFRSAQFFPGGVECRFHFSVGCASDPSAGPGLFFGSCSQRILRCHPTALHPASRLPLSPQSPHAADRGPRYPAAPKESSSSLKHLL